MKTYGFNITAVERDTGLSKDLLRMWERRYGFPSPSRDSNGERIYPVTQIERLRTIKRLIDRGFRPGKLFAMTDEEQHALLTTETPNAPSADILDHQPYLSQLSNGDLHGLRSVLQQHVARQGLHAFVLDTAVPLTIAVGEAWMQGKIRIHEEHAYTEMLHGLLRQAMSSLPIGHGPRLLLTTVPDEEHSLGLLMAEVLFSLEGAQCTSLGARTPLVDIVYAAQAHKTDAVALSFSASFPPRQAFLQLTELRRLLPVEIDLWIGGAGTERIQAIPGVQVGHGGHGPQYLIAEWHKAHPA